LRTRRRLRRLVVIIKGVWFLDVSTLASMGLTKAGAIGIVLEAGYAHLKRQGLHQGH
jgi:hypothetical protein